LQVGVAVVHFEEGSAGGRVARWNSSEFYVPPALEGAGFVGRFLTELVKLLEGRHAVKEMRVTVLDARPTAQDPHPRPRPDPASRARRLQLLEFYRSRGFLYDVSAGNSAGGFNQLVRRTT
jgi:hypothetical protein